MDPHVARECPRPVAGVDRQSGDRLARHLERRQAGLLRLGLDCRRRHVGRADDLLELEAVADCAPSVDAHDDCCDAERDEDCRGDDSTDFENLAHLNAPFRRGRACQFRALTSCGWSFAAGRSRGIGACTEARCGFPAGGISALELFVLAGAHASDHVAPALLRPRERHAPDVDAGEDRDDEHPHERGSGDRQRIVSMRALVAAEREAVQVDLDALGNVDVDRAEDADGEDRDTSPSNVAWRRSRSMLPRPTRQPTRRRRRSLPSRSLEPRSASTKRVGRRRDVTGACPTGRSRASSSSSSFVRARYAADMRSVNSSSVNRPCAACSRKSTTARSRSASEARRAGTSLMPAIVAQWPQPMGVAWKTQAGSPRCMQST